MLANDDHVVALHVTRAERDGRQLEINAIQVFQIGDLRSQATPDIEYGARVPEPSIGLGLYQLRCGTLRCHHR